MVWTTEDLARRDAYPYVGKAGAQAFLMELGREPVSLATPGLRLIPVQFEAPRTEPRRPVIIEGRALEQVSFDLEIPEGNPGAGAYRLEDYVPMLAVGSNAAPEQLARKFRSWCAASDQQASAPIVCLPIRVKGLAAVFSAHVSPYGAIPLTLGEVPGRHTLYLLLLPGELMHAMNASESLGINYCLARWTPSPDQVETAFAGDVPFAYTYLSRHGMLVVDGAVVPYSPEGSRRPLDQTRLRQRLWPLIKDTPVIQSALDSPTSGDTPEGRAAREDDPLGALLISDAAVPLVTNALKQTQTDRLPASVEVIGGSNGFAELANRMPETVRLIPSGEQTFSRGVMRALVSEAGRRQVEENSAAVLANQAPWLAAIDRWFGLDRLCVLTTFHPLVRQELRVLCRLRTQDFSKGVKIYGRQGLKRHELEQIDSSTVAARDRFKANSDDQLDPIQRDYVSAYKQGGVCVVPQSIRGALGFAFDDKNASARIELVEIGLVDRLRDICSSLLMGWQDSHVRVAKLPIEDMEKSIARVPPNVIDILGTVPGYDVVLEAACRLEGRYVYKRKVIRALVCTKDHMAERTSRPDFKPSLKARYVNTDVLLGVSDLHPVVMLDRSARTDLLTNDEDSSYPDEGPDTFLQPLRIRRSNLGLCFKEAVLILFSLAAFTFGVRTLLDALHVPHAISGAVFAAVFLSYVSMRARYGRRAMKFKAAKARSNQHRT